MCYNSKLERAAIELVVKYINDHHVPNKAIVIIDKEGTCSRLVSFRKCKIPSTYQV
ncbi:MAG: hypothetical protein ACR5K4_03135 [Sodalis sp. (in: enterobacteria)]